MKKNSLGFRLLRLVTFWVTGNLTAIFAIWHAAVGWKILVGILCGILFLFFQFAHVHTMAGEKKLASLAHGCDLLRTSTVWFCLELLTAGALFRGREIVLGNSADRSGCVLSALLVHSVSGAAAYRSALHTGETAVACCPLFSLVGAAAKFVSGGACLSYCQTGIAAGVCQSRM